MQARWFVAVMLIAASALFTTRAEAEVVSQTFHPQGWSMCGPHCYYLRFPMQLGFGVSDVDSVWVEVTGLSHEGYFSYPIGGGYYFGGPCWDMLFVSFSGEPGQGECDEFATSSDGVADCIGGAIVPHGDQLPFVTTTFLSGGEIVISEPRSFAVLEERPSLGALFADQNAILTIRVVDGGVVDRCRSGTADVTLVTVNVAYNSALPTERHSWGALKLLYR